MQYCFVALFRCICFRNMFRSFTPIVATTATRKPSEIPCTYVTLYSDGCTDYLSLWPLIWCWVSISVSAAEGSWREQLPAFQNRTVLLWELMFGSDVWMIIRVVKETAVLVFQEPNREVRSWQLKENSNNQVLTDVFARVNSRAGSCDGSAVSLDQCSLVLHY